MPNIVWLRSNWMFLLFIAFGIFLRLIWVNDMEWKSDEQYMYTQAQMLANTGHLPKVGMESGGGIVNPGFGMALFAAMAYFVHTPTAMAQIVQWTNVMALLCFFLFILFKIEKQERDIWLWGLALAAVSPLAVLFSRKIWAQDILPIFCFLVIWSNTYRHKKWGAFLWGLFGALIGQIHMSGFFYAAGLFIFTVVYDYRNKQPFKWGYWLAGSILGSIGLIPWLLYLSSHAGASNFDISHVFQFNVYIYAFLDSHGLNTMYSLHKNFWDFVKEPYISGYPTYLIGVLNIVLACTGIYTATRIWIYLKKLYLFIQQKQLFEKLTTHLTSTNFYLLSLFLGLGIIMSFCGIVVCQHYLIVAFPFTYIFVAKIFREKKKLFLAIICAQFILTSSFLIYIHTHNGAPQGDYGTTYRAQQIKMP